MIEARVSEYKASVDEWGQKMAAAFQDTLAAERADFEKEKEALQHMQDALQREQQLLKEEQENLAAERADFEREREAVKKAVDMSDIVELNVGGAFFTARRSTLCASDGMLGAMFSGRWDHRQFGRDKDGRIYLELNRDCFEVILEWLRVRGIDPEAPFPAAPAGKEAIFQSVLRFLEIRGPAPGSIDLSSAEVAEYSSRGGALGTNPSEIFSDSNYGWTSAGGRPSPWLILDLKQPRSILRLALTFALKSTINGSFDLSSYVPRKVSLSQSSTRSGPWSQEAEGRISGLSCTFEELSGSARFFRLSFELAVGKEWVALRRVEAQGH